MFVGEIVFLDWFGDYIVEIGALGLVQLAFGGCSVFGEWCEVYWRFDYWWEGGCEVLVKPNQTAGPSVSALSNRSVFLGYSIVNIIGDDSTKLTTDAMAYQYSSDKIIGFPSSQGINSMEDL